MLIDYTRYSRGREIDGGAICISLYRSVAARAVYRARFFSRTMTKCRTRRNFFITVTGFELARLFKMHICTRVYNYSSAVCLACLLAKLAERKAQESGTGHLYFLAWCTQHSLHIMPRGKLRMHADAGDNPWIGGAEVELAAYWKE